MPQGRIVLDRPLYLLFFVLINDNLVEKCVEVFHQVLVCLFIHICFEYGAAGLKLKSVLVMGTAATIFLTYIDSFIFVKNNVHIFFDYVNITILLRKRCVF